MPAQVSGIIGDDQDGQVCVTQMRNSVEKRNTDYLCMCCVMLIRENLSLLCCFQAARW